MSSPRFKNWPEICKLSKSHHFLMLAIATLNLHKPDAIALNMIRMFPTMFSEKEVQGPIPLSVIRSIMEELVTERAADYPGTHWHETNLPQIPIQVFDIYGRNVADLDGPKLPEGIDPHSRQGDIVTWQGKKFVVLENNESCQEMYITPLECVNPEA